MPIILLTAYGTIKNAVQAMKKGAYSYLTKPFDDQELLLQIKNGLEKGKLSKEVKRLRDIVKEMHGFEKVVGESKKMKVIMAQVIQAAKTDSNIYIFGESGTGKELIAKNLHVASPRKDFPFLAINCAAIPETLLESELFGYEEGAFTGATRRKKGIFTMAHKGTLFLDEISEMSSAMQVKLLRILETKEFHPLGSEKIAKVDVRIIVASNKNLRGRGRKRYFPQGPLLPHPCYSYQASSSQGKKRRYTSLGRIFSTETYKKNEKGHERFFCICLTKTYAIRLAWQCQRIGKYH